MTQLHHWALRKPFVVVQSLSHVDSSQPHRLQHARFLCPTLYPGVCLNSSPLSRWCHPTISSSVVPFFSCPQSSPASGSSPVSQLFATGGQSSGASASASVFLMNEYWLEGLISFRTGLISLTSKGLSRVFSWDDSAQKHQFFGAQPSLWSNFHIHTWLLEKSQLWLYRTLSSKWCLCFLIQR